jgi:hypothetical protein
LPLVGVAKIGDVRLIDGHPTDMLSSTKRSMTGTWRTPGCGTAIEQANQIARSRGVATFDVEPAA